MRGNMYTGAMERFNACWDCSGRDRVIQVVMLDLIATWKSVMDLLLVGQKTFPQDICSTFFTVNTEIKSSQQEQYWKTSPV